MTTSEAALATAAVWGAAVALACARRHTPAARVAVIALGTAAVPFAWPVQAFAARVLAVGFAVSFAMKLWLAFGTAAGPRDPAARATVGRFCLWLLVPPEVTWPRDGAAAACHRRAGLLRLARVPPKAALLVGIALSLTRLRGPAAAALRPFEFYAFLSCLSDVVTGATMAIGGVGVDEAFARPFASPSVGAFWARRWNLPVSGFLRACVFAPVARRRRSAAAGVAAAFAASAAMHEYVVAALVGWKDARFGYMTAFFALQALAVGAQRRMRTGTGASLVMTLAWLVATSPLFFAPLAPAIARFDAAVRASIGVR